MTEAEKNELKRQLLQQATDMNARYKGLYSSVYQAYLEKAFKEIDKGTYQPKQRNETEASDVKIEKTSSCYRGNKA